MRHTNLSCEAVSSVTILAAIAISSALSTESSAATFLQRGPRDFQVQVLHAAGTPIFGLAAGELGDIQPDSGALRSFVALGGNGTILHLTRDGLTWSAAPLPIMVEPCEFMTSRPTLNVGDVRPEIPGNEIAVKSTTNVHVLVQSMPNVWTSQIVFDGEKTFGVHWGVRLGVIDPTLAGEQLFHIHEGLFDFSQGFYATPENGGWTSEAVYSAEVGMDSAIGDSNPPRAGNEIVVGTEMGPVYEITPMPGSPGPWPRTTLWDDFDNAPWTLRIADVLPDQPGNEIVYGTRYSTSILLSYPSGRPDGSHDVTTLFVGAPPAGRDMNIWDIGLGPIDPQTPTLEIVGVDDAGLVYLVQFDGAQWSGAPIWQNPDGPYFAVVVADLQPQCPGADIVVAGQSGAITLLAPRIALGTDLDCDGAVDAADLAILLGAWNGSGVPADVNGDGVVDAADLALLLGSWSM